MKVIFLDIDGVLNVMCDERDEFGHLFHKPFEENLRRIIDATGAKIVISSSWRHSGLAAMRAMWMKRGLPGEVIDITPTTKQLLAYERADYYDAICRGAEIQMWLDDNNADAFVILDDDDDMLQSQRANFVRCYAGKDVDGLDLGYGLTTSRAARAIQILTQ